MSYGVHRRSRQVLRVAAVGTGCLLAATLTACSDTKSPTPRPSPIPTHGPISYDPKDSQGPAVAAPGAVRGGTLTILMPFDLGDLDPALNYNNTSEDAMTLVYRTLTTYKEQLQPGGGVSRVLVGDLAETAGEDVHHNCKVWRYTLKQGLRFEDGSAITAADVAYGIARSFAPDLSSGPHYIQQWLTDSQSGFNQTYRGPYDGGALVPPGITIPDDRTIQFDFAHPHCEMPYAAALPMTSPVPRAKDTRQAYGSRPFASGPYRIVETAVGASFTFARNPYWEPTTDAVRTADPDEIRFTLNLNADGLIKRLIADEGADRTAMTWLNVIPPDIALAQSPDVQPRIVSGPTPFLAYLGINTQRITDINVRRAINIAIDKQAVVQAIGGAPVGIPTGQLLPPSIPGYHAYNAFPGTPVTGDPDKARQMLGSKTVHLSFATRGGPGAGYQETAIRDALQKAGFVVTLQPVTNAQATPGSRDNPYDIYLLEWGADWPTGGSMLAPLFDGRTISEDGNTNSSYLNADPINTKIAQILNEPADQAADQWGALDEQLMTDYAPVVPLFVQRAYLLVGSGVGGYYLSYVYGLTGLNTIYVKP